MNFRRYKTLSTKIPNKFPFTYNSVKTARKQTKLLINIFFYENIRKCGIIRGKGRNKKIKSRQV